MDMESRLLVLKMPAALLLLLATKLDLWLRMVFRYVTNCS